MQFKCRGGILWIGISFHRFLIIEAPPEIYQLVVLVRVHRKLSRELDCIIFQILTRTKRFINLFWIMTKELVFKWDWIRINRQRLMLRDGSGRGRSLSNLITIHSALLNLKAKLSTINSNLQRQWGRTLCMK